MGEWLMRKAKKQLAITLVALVAFLIFPCSSNAADELSLPTPTNYLYALADDVISSVDHKGIENSLLAKLNTAIKKLNDVNENNNVAAVNTLRAFINSVHAKNGKKISQEDADRLIADAQQIIGWLEGNPPVWVRDALIVSNFGEITVELDGFAGRISAPVNIPENFFILSGLATDSKIIYVLTSSYDHLPLPYETIRHQLPRSRSRE